MAQGKLSGRVAIVCGAGSVADGISNGMATAVLFAREGARVFAVDRDIELARETQRMVRTEGGECELHQADVGDDTQVMRMVSACVERFGGVDVLFNNVGIHIRGGPLEESPADFERVVRVNLTAMYYTIRAALPHMLKAGRGSIINNSSVAGIRAMLPNAAYAASKAGVLGLTQNVGVTYAGKGIRCNAVVPGYIATPRVTRRLSMESCSDPQVFEAKLKERARQVPSGRLGEAWDIANAVLFLAGDDSKYVNATSIVVDGGLSASTTGEPW